MSAGATIPPPRGLLYWCSLYPVHGAIFSGMIAGLAAAASRPAGRPGGVAASSP